MTRYETQCTELQEKVHDIKSCLQKAYFSSIIHFSQYVISIEVSVVLNIFGTGCKLLILVRIHNEVLV